MVLDWSIAVAPGIGGRLPPTASRHRWGLPTRQTTTRVVVVEILPSARKHGVSDDHIRHGLDNAVAAINTPDQPDFIMVIGANMNGQLLEIGVLADDDNDYVIHAMPARSKYLKMIKPK